MNAWHDTEPAVMWHSDPRTLNELGPDRSPVIGAKIAACDFPVCGTLDEHAQSGTGFAGLAGAQLLASGQLREVDAREVQAVGEFLAGPAPLFAKVGFQVHQEYTDCVSMCPA